MKTKRGNFSIRSVIRSNAGVLFSITKTDQEELTKGFSVKGLKIGDVISFKAAASLMPMGDPIFNDGECVIKQSDRINFRLTQDVYDQLKGAHKNED